MATKAIMPLEDYVSMCEAARLIGLSTDTTLTSGELAAAFALQANAEPIICDQTAENTFEFYVSGAPKWIILKYKAGITAYDSSVSSGYGEVQDQYLCYPHKAVANGTTIYADGNIQVKSLKYDYTQIKISAIRGDIGTLTSYHVTELIAYPVYAKLADQ